MSLQLFDLSGKVAVITGGTGVLGSAITKGLVSAGAKVAILARTAKDAQELASEIEQNGREAMGIAVDVLDKVALESTRELILKRFGRVDILVNGAGGNHPDATTLSGQKTFFELPQEAMQWVFDLNFMGSVLPSQVFGEVMVQQESGVILNISSMASYQAITRVISYSGAKAAINNFTQWLAVYMAREHSPNIRVNAIAPGFFIGRQNRDLLIDKAQGKLTERGQQIIDNTPANRFGEAEELVGTVIWLVSDASRFVTGIVVPVDGGFNAFSGV